MIIDCSDCTARPSACADCVVTVLLGPEIADEHEAAIAVLADSGLVPPLRLIPGGARSSGDPARRAAGA